MSGTGAKAMRRSAGMPAVAVACGASGAACCLNANGGPADDDAGALADLSPATCTDCAAGAGCAGAATAGAVAGGAADHDDGANLPAGAVRNALGDFGAAGSDPEAAR
ncbi:hypothetical protein HaLaN_23174 [Haematococcus lacustris]|uniref:Uncharacterized protein n=1 Tax=Haematococcus lacustris TaxID=44745 RepID=A0A699ZSA1_HAELA|nr:hypothetical protein HaLaN_23174 [Haematococcus lacustris]